MIGLIRGKLLEKTPSLALVEAAGVGYEIEIPLSTSFALPESENEIVLHTHLVVREDAQLLFGFISKSDRDLFRLLIKVNGVGPKLGVAILSGLDANQLLQCIEQEDVSTLVKLPGIGKKTAERLLIDMRDRIKQFEKSGNTGQGLNLELSPVAANDPADEAEAALIALGYKPAEATKMVKAVGSDVDTVEDIIKQALKNLQKK